MSVATRQRVFISYRREETAGHAGRLYDALSERFGPDSVFMDVDLPPGIDFVDRITEAVGSCDVLLAVIGPRWTTITGDGGARRIEIPDDFVRLEVETALQRANIVVIPILVAGARIPQLEDLPPDLRSLARRNALELSDGRWRYDVSRLIESLEPVLAERVVDHGPVDRTGPERKPADEWSSRTRTGAEAWAATALVLAVVAGVSGVAGRGLASVVLPSLDGLEKVPAVLDFAAIRAITWGVVGAVVAVSFTRALRGSAPTAGRALAGLAIGALWAALGGVAYAVPRYLVHDFDPEGSLNQWLLVVALAIAGAGVAVAARPDRRRLSLALIAGALAGALGQYLVNHIGFLNTQPEGNKIRVLLLHASLAAGLVALALWPRRADRLAGSEALGRVRHERSLE